MQNRARRAGAGRHPPVSDHARRAQAVRDARICRLGGVKEGMIRVDAFGPVPAAVQTEVLARQKDIVSGCCNLPTLQERQRGRWSLPPGRRRATTRFCMNWLADGVVGKLAR